MVKTRTLACLFAIPHFTTSLASDIDDEGLTLLQLRASSMSLRASSMSGQLANSSRANSRDDPGARERAQCPHEIEVEEVVQGNKAFGCAGTMRAVETVKCSIWGEPHVTALWTGQPKGSYIDILYKSGLWRMAAAQDGSWEVQLFNCGLFASAVAARFGKSLIEVFVTEGGQIKYYLNGAEVPSLPAEGIHGVKLDSTHRSIITDAKTRASAGLPGTCADHPGGQISIDIAQDLGNPRWGNARRNINVKLEAASDSVTKVADDPYSICSVEPLAQGLRNGEWENQMVEPENSLFTIGELMCAGCNGHIGWDDTEWRNKGSHIAARRMCAAASQKSAEQVNLESICRNMNVAVQDAVNACTELQENPRFFQDCQIDFCASGGQDVAAEEAVGEEALENPQPRCVNGDCDPASKCCDALRDQATLTLDNVMTSNLCSGGELRFASALTQNGQTMDLVVKAVGNLVCDDKLNDSRFGSKNAEIGMLSVLAGTSQAFEFSFVRHSTNTPATPQNLMMSFLDIDQGKKSKQRESIEVCGGGNAITTDDTELEIAVTGDCIKVTSTTHGTGSDNPDSVEGMSQMQRARTAAFEVTGSSFTATLGVSKIGKNPRRFNFAGHPSVACVLK